MSILSTGQRACTACSQQINKLHFGSRPKLQHSRQTKGHSLFFLLLQAKYATTHYSKTQIFFPASCFLVVVIQRISTKMQELLKVAGVHQGLAVYTFCLIFKKNITSQELWLWLIKNKQSGATRIL